MKTTTDALLILGKRMTKFPRLQRMVEEERVNLQAAHAIRDARRRAKSTPGASARQSRER